MLSNRTGAKSSRIASSFETYTVTAFRPTPERGFPEAIERAGGADTAQAFMTESGPELFQAGAYLYQTTLTWRPRTALDEGTFAEAARGPFGHRVRPGDLLVVYETRAVFVITDGPVLRAPCGLADLAGYPQAQALQETPRPARFLTTQYKDLRNVMAQTINGWDRRSDDLLRLQRTIRVTRSDFARLVVTILFQDAEAAGKGEPELGLRQVLRDVVVEGFDELTPPPKTES